MTDARSHDPYRGLRDLERRGRRAGGWEGGGPARPAPSGAQPADRLAELRVPRRRRPRRGRQLAVALASIALVVVLLVGGLIGYTAWRLGQINRVEVPALTAAAYGPMTVLVIGSDTRSLHGKGDAAQYGSASQVTGQRSDTAMLVRLDPRSHKMAILSVPRDLWVNIPGMGPNRVNAAFGAGPNLLVDTIQRDLGIPIEHVVIFNFDSFESVTDAVGGVRVWFPTPARDAYSLLNVPRAGCVNLTGAQALGFARSRHYQYYEHGTWQTQGLSDLARIQRQQLFVKKMARKAESKVTDPFALNGIVGGITANLTVDSRFSSADMLRLAWAFHHASLSNVPTATLPVYNEYQGAAEVLGLQQPAASQAIKAFNDFGGPTRGAAAPPGAGGPVTASVVTASSGLDTGYPLPGPAPTQAELRSC